ncbi:ABC transporter permease [Clostridium fermenticellae]|uniref:ABC transporter permease n=1 Tax=Clostridium fermenticellae TaxID=2068654 RepID=A0A386H235_9CLOT|nr:ABC transporter permease [Clostridium fermenticellae]AYD39740.1 ABC transporter permease [Clostridium fermenticellae]
MIDEIKEHKVFIDNIKKERKKVVALRIILLVSIFALWEISGDLKWIDPFLTSTPSRMFKTLIKLYNEGNLFTNIGITCLETIIGFTLGTFLGTIIAVLLWCSKLAAKVLDPYIVVLNALPKIALAPIIIFWVGNGITAIIVITLLISIVVTIITILDGFNSVDNDKIKLLKTFGARKFQTLTHLIIPATVPTFLSALKINVGLSWVGVIMGEFLVAKEGLGFLIVFGGQTSELDTVMLSILILSILAYLMYEGVNILEKKLISKLNH